MLAKASNELSAPTRKDSCRSNSCGSACLRCVSANRHSALSCRRSPTRPTTGLHSYAWPRPSLHSSLAFAVPPKRLVSLSASESYGSWLKTFWWGKIRLPFVTASRSPRVRRKTEVHSQKVQITFCVRGVISPLLANIYLHYILDEWFEEVVKPRLKGEAHEIRFADDAILCFQHKEDAEKVLSVLPKRFEKYGLTLHPEKTRLIEFGRDAARKAKEQGKKPETFNFLGFTHICARSRKGRFAVHVKTITKRLRRGLKAVADWCKQHRHDPVDEQQKTLNAKLRGHYQYYGRPTNYRSIWQFYRRVRCIWREWLGRRTRGHGMTWQRFKNSLRT